MDNPEAGWYRAAMPRARAPPPPHSAARPLRRLHEPLTNLVRPLSAGTRTRSFTGPTHLYAKMYRAFHVNSTNDFPSLFLIRSQIFYGILRTENGTPNFFLIFDYYSNPFQTGL